MADTTPTETSKKAEDDLSKVLAKRSFRLILVSLICGSFAIISGMSLFDHATTYSSKVTVTSVGQVIITGTTYRNNLWLCIGLIVVFAGVMALISAASSGYSLYKQAIATDNTGATSTDAATNADES